MMKLLIAEDQKALLDVLEKRLKEEGYVVDAVSNGEDAYDFLRSTMYDLCVFDIMMPGKSGLELIRYLRDQQIDTPVLFLTAKDAVDDRVLGLRSGADDYLIKPFDYKELLARIDVLLRRRQTPVTDVIRVADLTIYRQSREVYRQDHEITLTHKEFNVLEYLALHAGQVVDRETLDRVSSNFDYQGYSNVIDVYIRMLRKKIDEPFALKLIHTVRGVGYQLVDKS